MSDRPRDITLERVNRVTQAVADLMESHAAQGRGIMRVLAQINERLDSVDAKLAVLTRSVQEIASEQALLGNRVEDAFHRALRANIRMDDLEDKEQP